MKRILITEDDQFVAKIYESKFQTEGFEVTIAANGKAAIEQIEKRSPDVLLLDLMLPELNGVEVLKFVRSQGPNRNLPVIVLSHAYAGNLVQAAWRAGANKCLSKANCSPNQLIEETKKLLKADEIADSSNGQVPSSVDEGTEGRVDFQATLRRGLRNKMPQIAVDLRHLMQNLARPGASTPGALLELFRATHALSGRAGLAGFARLAQFASALEALLNELHSKPASVNPSTMRTVAQAVDVLTTLLAEGAQHEEGTSRIPLIMAVDDDTISRDALCLALQKAQLRAVAIDDPEVALKVLAVNKFDLVFLDVEMPGMSGFEVCKNLRALPSHAQTPVVFVTGLTGFDTRAQSALSGGTDLIAKPIVFIELAVKALIHLVRARPLKS